jgi:formylglycine-generating enzyme required for sulfatase activity/TolB-like protein
MKRIHIALLLLIFSIPFACVSAASGKTKIAVLDFQLQGDKFTNDDMGAIVAEWFITAMVNAGRFDIVERSLLQKILSEQKLVMTGMVDTGSATQIGKLLGAKVIITGSVMRLGDTFEINARMIDVESTSIISAEHEKTADSSQLQNLVVSLSKKMIGKFPLEGFVVSRTAQEIGIDLGVKSGVQEGMTFTIFKEGKVIKHPVSGEILDVERIETGTATVTAVLERISQARITGEVNAGAIEYGQSVKSRAVDAKVKATAQGRPKKDVEVHATARPESSPNKEPAGVPRATMGAFSFILPQGWVKVKDTDIGDVYAKLDKNGDPHAMVQFDGEIVAEDRKAYEKNIIARMKDYRAARITTAGSNALQLSSYSEDSGTIFFIFPYDAHGTSKVTVIYNDKVDALSSDVLELLATAKIVRPPPGEVKGSLSKDAMTGMEFVQVPGGCFAMGDTFGDGGADEQPVHEVCLDGFYLGKFEVTQGEYRRVTNENPSQIKKGDDLPVESVTWSEAQIFIEKLNSLTGRHYRLPTEAEWEYAARSGGKKEKYAGGNDLSTVAWYRDNSGATIKPGGGKRPNGLGLYDMSGNVNEWCHDWADGRYYEKSPKNNPYGPSSGSKRIIRGGAANGKAETLRVTRRVANDPDKPTPGVGLRLAHPVR